MKGVYTLQSNSVLNLEIQNPFGETTLCNPFSFYAEDNWAFLESVYSNKTAYFSQAYSVLANTMEQFYKGVYAELLKIGLPVPKAEEYELHGHHFDNFVRKINKVLPVSKCAEGYYAILDNCERIQKGYTDSKYNAYYEKSDFDKDFKRYEVQRQRLYKGLEAEKQKYLARDVSNLPDKREEGDDLDFYR